MTNLAFVFPGQGSQKMGMLQDAREASADLFAEASSVLGYDLWDLVENGPEDQLNQTEYTQPALLTASVGLFRLAQARGLPLPDVVAGHSLVLLNMFPLRVEMISLSCTILSSNSAMSFLALATISSCSVCASPRPRSHA